MENYGEIVSKREALDESEGYLSSRDPGSGGAQSTMKSIAP